MNIRLADKTIEIRLSNSAKQALAERSTPLLAEMELLFSCLIRKRVRFSEWLSDPHSQSATPVSDHLAICFRPVMTRVCAVSEVGGAPPMDDFPIANPRPFIPHWLAIDFRRGEWLGEFGY